MKFPLKTKITTQLILVFVLLAVNACSNRPNGVLSENDMSDLLTDMHKLEGAMSAKSDVPNWDLKSGYYSSVLKKHGVTQAQFDSSLLYYTHNPKKFEYIYIDVINNLTKLQSDINKGKYHEIDSSEIHKIKYNIWQKRTKFVLTKDSTRNKIEFLIPDQNFMLSDQFTLKFKQRIGKGDSATNRLIRFQINYTDGFIHGILYKVKTDNVTRRYTIRLWSTHAKKIKSISGELLACDAYKGKQDATVDSITLFRSYDTTRQDSLLKILQKNDPKNYPVHKIENNIREIHKFRNIRRIVLMRK